MADNFVLTSISEIQGRPDFTNLLKIGLEPLLVQGTELEVNDWKGLFQSIKMSRYSMTFYAMGGLTVGRIVEGQEIPFVSLGTGRITVTAEEYGVRAGYTHQMIRDGEIDIMRYTTQELGRAFARTQSEVAFGTLKNGAGFKVGYKQALDTTNHLGIIDALRLALLKGQEIKEKATKIPRPVYYDTIVMNPVDADAIVPYVYGDTTYPTGMTFDPATAKLTGLLGCRVIITPWLSKDTIILCKANDGMMYLEREGLNLAHTERFETACEEVRLMSAWTFAIIKSQNVVRLYKDDTTSALSFVADTNAPWTVEI